MSNIKLKDHNWAAEGIYDTNQSKSQQTINSDVSTKIGQATLQTSSQNLSGATNELKGRADTLDSKYDNVVTVANTQPSSEHNKVWLPLTVSEGTQVPTWAEHQALESSLSGAITSLENQFVHLGGLFNNVECSPAASTTLATLTLTKGTWILTGYHEFNTNINAIYSNAIIDTANNLQIARSQNQSQANGGGITTTAVIVITANTVINYTVYNGGTAANTARRIRFDAIRIID